jgi:hypothetical protein
VSSPGTPRTSRQPTPPALVGATGFASARTAQEASRGIWPAGTPSASTQGLFTIFHTFASEEGRNAHLWGRVAAALLTKAGEVLAEPPHIEKYDVLAFKV